MVPTCELNILCIGELTSNKSIFLSFYTQQPNDEKYKVFLHKEKIKKEHSIGLQQGSEESLAVFLHDLQDFEGSEVYLKYSFDAILFFVKIDAFHNTSKNVLDAIQHYSQINGSNVYRVPFRMVVLSTKNQYYYDDIGYGDKQNLWMEVCDIVTLEQIIFVEFNAVYKEKLSCFYQEIMREEALGIMQNSYTNWHFRGIYNYFSIDQFKLTIFKMYEEWHQLINKRLKQANIIKN